MLLVYLLKHSKEKWSNHHFLTAAYQSGATPIIIMTKRDLCSDYISQKEKIEKIAPLVPAIAVSSVTGEGLDEVLNYVEPYKNIVFLGSSGIGKSSLVNAISGEEIMKVNTIREDDSKGRHTTTHRQLIKLENHGMIIDTPGMRELGLWDVSEGLDKAFDEIEEFAKKCKFKFKKLFEIAVDECSKRSFDKILLLSDGKSNSGGEFINNIGGKYDFSEYRMKRVSSVIPERMNSISLRKAENQDVKEIARQNSIYFNDSEEAVEDSEAKGVFNESTHMAELDGNIIGKINIEYSEKSAFICGFGILPDFRGKGYGKAALKEALYLISEKDIYTVELDVECKNSTALNLYKDCGFEEKSIMNYYKYKAKL